MHDLQACLFKYITVAAFCIYAQCVEDAAKRVGWRPCISHGNALLIMENHGKNHWIVFLNFCGNPVNLKLLFLLCLHSQTTVLTVYNFRSYINIKRF